MMVWKAALVGALAAACCQDASGQTLAGLSGTYDRTIHARGPTGHLCLGVKTDTRANTILSNSFQHIVTFDNSCSKAISVKVCYRGSEDCKQVSAGPHQETTVFMGEMTGVPGFNVDYFEKLQR